MQRKAYSEWRQGPRARASSIDKHVGARMRERRIMLGLTQQQMAELVDVTYQQAHKYERGINRVACGRLYTIANALGVDVNYFFKGLDVGEEARPSHQQRMLLDLARNFQTITTQKHRDAICSLARALSNEERLETIS